MPAADRTSAAEQVERIEAALHGMLTGTLAYRRPLAPLGELGTQFP
jgi:hypothetical protein